VRLPASAKAGLLKLIKGAEAAGFRFKLEKAAPGDPGGRRLLQKQERG
jgi:hypothetical protein